jgi:hypothetical protein
MNAAASEAASLAIAASLLYLRAASQCEKAREKARA